MRIQVDFSALKRSRWYEVLVRFVLGGLITAATGLIAKKYGPAVGGLFLAFPAIFPASVTLIEKHERERKQKAGMRGAIRARKAASVDSAGAAMGSIGLLAFALLIAQLITAYKSWVVMLAATLSWMAVSALVWHLRKHELRSRGIWHPRSAARRPPSS